MIFFNQFMKANKIIAFRYHFSAHSNVECWQKSLFILFDYLKPFKVFFERVFSHPHFENGNIRMPVTNRSVFCWIQIVIQTNAFEFYLLDTGQCCQSILLWASVDFPSILGFVFICICFSIDENSFKIKIRVDFGGKKIQLSDCIQMEREQRNLILIWFIWARDASIEWST